jgi:SNF2 family DNA or RNA helicase
MIKIEKHVRGVAVSVDNGLDRNPRTRNLELQLAAYQAFVSRGRLITSLEAAGVLLDILGVVDAVWDQDLLSVARYTQRHREMQEAARLEVADALEDPYTTLAGYSYLDQLDKHQVEAVAAIAAPSLKGIAIFDEQGTGKTIMALAAFEWLRERGDVQRLLVISPKSVLSAWQVQCKKFLGNRYRAILLGGSAAERRRTLLCSHDILLVGYETAVASENILRTIISARPFSYMLVVDESYFVKNPATARAQVVERLRTSCERAVVLCGTPAPNSALDVVNQVNIADGGVTFAGRNISRDTEAAYTEVAEALQDAIYLRRLKDEVLPEIPPKQIEKVYIELTSHQRSLYNHIRDEIVLEVQGVDDREFARRLNFFMAKRVRLLQVCSNPRMLDPLYDEVPAKIRALDHIISELVGGMEKKVVIWSYFRASLEYVAERYRKYGVVRIDGTVARVRDRLCAVEKFQNDSSTRIFVGNAAAAGAGITLTAAHHAIYESLSNQAAHYLQSVDRIHRRGQFEHAVSHILIASNTIEEQEYQSLMKKERLGRELLGDRYEEPMTRERFLADLEGKL